MSLELEWVDEIPKTSRAGAGRESKYAKLVETLRANEGKTAKLGPFTRSTASAAVGRIKKLGASATSRTEGEDIFIYARVEAVEGADEYEKKLREAIQ